MADDRELLAKLIENPDDVQAHLVFADWLQSHGDPRGELIVLQHGGRTEEADALIEKHADHFYGPLQRYRQALDGSGKTVFEWHLGFIRSARLSFDSNSYTDVLEDAEEDSGFFLPDAIHQLLTHPSGALLQTLDVPLNMLDDGCYFEPVAKAIAKDGSPSLRTLRLGHYRYAGARSPRDSDYDYEISWTSFGDVSGIWAALPRLEKATFLGNMGDYHFGGAGAKLGPIRAPRLKHLEVISGGTSKACLRAIAEAEWPELRFLDLWLGSDSYGFDGSLEDLKPLLDGKGLPRIEHLGLLNAEIADEICAALPGSGVLPRLKELSLALGTMSDEGAESLMRSANAFAHLALLDVEGSYLSEGVSARLRKIAKDVLVGEQREAEDDRYASVGE